MKKRWMAGALGLVFVISLAGCGFGQEEPDSNEQIMQEQETEKQTEEDVSETEDQTAENGTGNVLVAYFSWADNAVLDKDVDAVTSPSVISPGNVQQLAGWVQEETGGDLFPIRVTDPYPCDWDDCLDRANEEMSQNIQESQGSSMNLRIGDTVLTAAMEDNSSVQALMEMLTDGPVEIDMQDYGDMEKVGSLGKNLPTNDEQITTEAGDLILYQGNSFVIYYAPNSWNFTRLGKINDVSEEELREILGDGDISVTLSLTE